MQPHIRARILLAAGSVVAVISAAVFVLAPRRQLGFGWYTNAPVINSPAVWYFLDLDPARRWAVVLGILGLVVASGAAGFLWGRQRN